MNKAVGVIIMNDNEEILLFRRGPKVRSQQGRWESCGGAVEEGETNEEAAKRECMEEAGMEVEIVEELFDYTDEDGWHGHVFKARLITEPKIQDVEICSEMKWVKKEELNDMDLTTYCRTDFEKLGWI